ncbi:MAG: hypothetical protein H0W66_10850 [Chthoniobacterales bacterium]|nr:hypothetical protein [Chthoniobacterales bacterium]
MQLRTGKARRSIPTAHSQYGYSLAEFQARTMLDYLRLLTLEETLRGERPSPL